jgi:hypothetical protein
MKEPLARNRSAIVKAGDNSGWVKDESVAGTGHPPIGKN